MKTLIVYYSGFGSNRALAEDFARRMDADIEGIRGGPDMSKIGVGIAVAWLRSILGLGVRIDLPKYDPSGYDLLVLASPVYAGMVPLQVKAYLNRFSGKIKNIAIASVSGSGNNPKAIAGMERLAGKKPLAVLELKAPENKPGADKKEFPKLTPEDLGKQEYGEKIDSFVDAIQKGF